MRACKRKHIQTSLIRLGLLIYLVSWIGNFQGLPLFMMMDNSHRASVTEKEGRIHIVINHTENRHDHEHDHEHDTVVGDYEKHKQESGEYSNTISGFAVERDHHSNHETQLFKYQERVIATNMAMVAKTFTMVLAVSFVPKFAETASLKHFPLLLPEVNSPLFCLRTTVLLI